MRKILIVDDSELLHQMYNLVLARYRAQGVQLLHALNGREALVRLQTNADADLILLDINMPVMTGLEFLRHRHQQQVFTDIPVIVISTEGAEEDTIAALRLGAAGYLTKPFSPPALHELIQQVVGMGGARPAREALAEA